MKTNFEKLFNHETNQALNNLEQAKRAYEKNLKQFAIDWITSKKDCKEDLEYCRELAYEFDMTDFDLSRIDNITALEFMVRDVIFFTEEGEIADLPADIFE